MKGENEQPLPFFVLLEAVIQNPPTLRREYRDIEIEIERVECNNRNNNKSPSISIYQVRSIYLCNNSIEHPKLKEKKGDRKILYIPFQYLLNSLICDRMMYISACDL